MFYIFFCITTKLYTDYIKNINEDQKENEQPGYS